MASAGHLSNPSETTHAFKHRQPATGEQIMSLILYLAGLGLFALGSVLVAYGWNLPGELTCALAGAVWASLGWIEAYRARWP